MRGARAIWAGIGLMIVGGTTAMLFPSLRDAVGIARPDSAQLSAARSLFATALDRATPTRLQQMASPAAFQAHLVDAQWQGVVLKEAEGQCEGRGIYLVRSKATLPLAITAPHRGSDRHTGTLASQLFAESGAAAAAWNSAPRKPSADCPHAIDLAKAEDHPFTAFAVSFAQHYPSGRVVQLHGFDRTKRTDAGGRDSGVILSNGTTEPDEALLDLADCLSIALAPLPVRVFPLETGELGALTNTQGTALRDVGFAGFLHIEMDLDLRLALTQDAVKRATFLQCLAGGLG